MIQGKLLSYGDDLNEVYNIRREVFVNEIGKTEETEFDDTDNEAIHVLVYEEVTRKEGNGLLDSKKVAVATGKIIYNGDICWISNVAVLRQYRNKKYGDFTVRMLLNRAFTAGINEVYLRATPETSEFFKKIGFQLNNSEYEKMQDQDFRMIIHDTDIVISCKK